MIISYILADAGYAFTLALNVYILVQAGYIYILVHAEYINSNGVYLMCFFLLSQCIFSSPMNYCECEIHASFIFWCMLGIFVS
jgi:hypothetical protein